jgi:hypothetical protein
MPSSGDTIDKIITNKFEIKLLRVRRGGWRKVVTQGRKG